MTRSTAGREEILYPAELAVGVTSERLRAVSPRARTLHRVILGFFARHGHAPSRSELGHDTTPLLAELHATDVVRFGTKPTLRYQDRSSTSIRRSGSAATSSAI